MRKSLRFYVEVLSLDICAGVIGSAAFAQSTLKAAMKPVWWFLLPASVWVVYTADHLLDAHKLGKNAVNIRHKFHEDNFTLLAVLAIAIALLCIVLAFLCFREIVFSGGVLLGFLALFHLSLAYWGKVRFGKEISVAVIYTCGIWFAPFLNRGVALMPVHGIALSLVFLAALLNLFMNAVIELPIDQQEELVFGMQHFSSVWARRMVICISLTASLAILIWAAISLLHRDAPLGIAAYFYLFMICVVPGFILLNEKYFSQNQRYRIPAEWVFLTGVFTLID